MERLVRLVDWQVRPDQLADLVFGQPSAAPIEQEREQCLGLVRAGFVATPALDSLAVALHNQRAKRVHRKAVRRLGTLFAWRNFAHRGDACRLRRLRRQQLLLDPQLALEAAALKAGAFPKIGRKEAQSLVYVRLKPGDRFKSEEVNNEGASRAGVETKSADQLAEESLRELIGLLLALRSGKYGFASRLIVQKERDYGGEYDHLARVAEWATADGDEDGSDG